MRGTKGNRKPCLFCGGEHAFKKEKCPAWDTKCLNCGGRNHFAKVCRKSKEAQRPDASITQIETDRDYAKEIYSVMEIENQAVTFQIDCGASINIITEALIRNSVVTSRHPGSAASW